MLQSQLLSTTGDAEGGLAAAEEAVAWASPHLSLETTYSGKALAAALDMVRNDLANKVKVPGFGHRVYRTEDPRATHLRVLSEELGRRTGGVPRAGEVLPTRWIE